MKIISSELKTRVFKKIKNSLNENGFCDLTGKEIGEEIAYSSTVVNFCIRSLVDKGICALKKIMARIDASVKDTSTLLGA